MNIQIKKLSETQIASLEEKGARRWTKYGKDRLYLSNLDKELLGIEVEYYKSGNICSASFNGEKVSNSIANRIISSLGDAYIDLANDELVIFTGKIDDEIIDSIIKALEGEEENNATEEIEEPATEEESEKEIIEEKVNAISDITYEYSEKTGVLSVKDYHGQSESVTIPAEVCGYKVYKIKYCAFDGNNTIKEVVISDGIKKIFGAFRGMANLEEVSILGDVEKINSGAFSNCPNLKKINASEKVIEKIKH